MDWCGNGLCHHGGNINGHFAGDSAASAASSSSRQLRAGAQTYLLYDGLGSTTDLTDGSGNVTATYTYDAFGALRSASFGAVEWNARYERTPPGGLYYLRRGATIRRCAISRG